MESMDETDDGLPVSESDSSARDSQSTRASAQTRPLSRDDRGEDNLEEQARIKDQGTLLNACILLLIYTYLTVSQYAIAMLECREVYLPAEKRDVSLLILEPSIECWGKEHVGTAAGPALAALVVCVRLAPAPFPLAHLNFPRYTLGVPILMALLLKWPSYLPSRMRLIGTGFLRGAYKRSSSNNELVLMGRRVLLLVVTALTDGSRARILWGANDRTLLYARFFFVNLILFASSVHHARRQPFKRALMNRIETACLSVLALLFNGEVVVISLDSPSLQSAMETVMSAVQVAALAVLGFFVVLARWLEEGTIQERFGGSAVELRESLVSSWELEEERNEEGGGEVENERGSRRERELESEVRRLRAELGRRQ